MLVRELHRNLVSCNDYRVAFRRILHLMPASEEKALWGLFRLFFLSPSQPSIDDFMEWRRHSEDSFIAGGDWDRFARLVLTGTFDEACLMIQDSLASTLKYPEFSRHLQDSAFLRGLLVEVLGEAIMLSIPAPALRRSQSARLDVWRMQAKALSAREAKALRASGMAIPTALLQLLTFMAGEGGEILQKLSWADSLVARLLWKGEENINNSNNTFPPIVTACFQGDPSLAIEGLLGTNVLDGFIVHLAFCLIKLGFIQECEAVGAWLIDYQATQILQPYPHLWNLAIDYVRVAQSLHSSDEQVDFALIAGPEGLFQRASSIRRNRLLDSCRSAVQRQWLHGLWAEEESADPASALYHALQSANAPLITRILDDRILKVYCQDPVDDQILDVLIEEDESSVGRLQFFQTFRLYRKLRRQDDDTLAESARLFCRLTEIGAPRFIRSPFLVKEYADLAEKSPEAASILAACLGTILEWHQASIDGNESYLIDQMLVRQAVRSFCQ